MRRVCLLALMFIITSWIHAQDQRNPAVDLAWRIANRMADTLQLSSQVRNKLFDANMELWKKKDDVIQKTKDREIVGSALQQIEFTRDSIYKTILSNIEYQLYLEKKRNLVNNNK